MKWAFYDCADASTSFVCVQVQHTRTEQTRVVAVAHWNFVEVAGSYIVFGKEEE